MVIVNNESLVYRAHYTVYIEKKRSRISMRTCSLEKAYFAAQLKPSRSDARMHAPP